MKTFNAKLLFLSVIILVQCLQAQWVITGGIPLGGGITDMVITPVNTIIVTCDSYNYPNGQLGGVRRSTDNGVTWTNGFNYFNSRTLALGYNNYVFCSGWDYPNNTEALYCSTNDGQNWAYVYTVGPNNNNFSILIRNNNQTIYIGARTGILKSTNWGSSFFPVNNGIPANSWVSDLDVDSNGVLAAATTNGLFISTNSASSWLQATGMLQGDTITRVCFEYGFIHNYKLLSGSNKGNIYRSNKEELYQLVQMQQQFFDSKVTDLSNILDYQTSTGVTSACIIGNPGVWCAGPAHSNLVSSMVGLTSTNLTATDAVVQQNDNSPANITYYVGLNDNQDNGAKVFKLESVISLKHISERIPTGFILDQNYPNPFNPSTTIRFSIPVKTKVKIIIYNAIGHEVAVPVDAELTSGTYEYLFNTANLSSGVYLYKLSAVDWNETKKMVIVK